MIHNLVGKLRKTRKNRSYFKSETFFLKTYESVDAAEYEFKAISAIKRGHPLRFDVPRVLKLVENSNGALCLMSCVNEEPLEEVLHRYLLRIDSDAIDIFFNVGQALRELHEIEVDYLVSRSYPSSPKKLLESIEKNIADIAHFGVSNLPFEKASCFNKVGLDSRLFEKVTLHGEAYFTHVFCSSKNIVFVDLEQVCNGPVYFDVANFLVSLHSSLLISPLVLNRVSVLERAFLVGYFGKSIPYDSLKLAELFIILRETLSCLEQLSLPSDLKSRYWRTFKLKRYRDLTVSLLNEFI